MIESGNKSGELLKEGFGIQTAVASERDSKTSNSSLCVESAQQASLPSGRYMQINGLSLVTGKVDRMQIADGMVRRRDRGCGGIEGHLPSSILPLVRWVLLEHQDRQLVGHNLW